MTIAGDRITTYAGELLTARARAGDLDVRAIEALRSLLAEGAPAQQRAAEGPSPEPSAPQRGRRRSRSAPWRGRRRSRSAP